MSWLQTHRLLVLNGILGLALAGGHWGRRIEAAAPTTGNLLADLQPQFRGWTATEESLDPSEVTLLRPDATLIRSFRSKSGNQVQLAVVAGHRKQSIHTPAFCMTGGGWELLSQQIYPLPLPDRTVPAVRSLMMRQGHQLLVTYFFTDGDYATPSLLRFQAVQLMERFEARVPLGALVRVSVPVRSTVKEASALSDAFASDTVPPVLARLREAHLTVR